MSHCVHPPGDAPTSTHRHPAPTTIPPRAAASSILKNARHAARRERRRVLTRSAWFTRSSHVAMPVGGAEMSGAESNGADSDGAESDDVAERPGFLSGTSPYAHTETYARPATHTTSSACVASPLPAHMSKRRSSASDPDSNAFATALVADLGKHRALARARPLGTAAATAFRVAGTYARRASTRASNVS